LTPSEKPEARAEGRPTIPELVMRWSPEAPAEPTVPADAPKRVDVGQDPALPILDNAAAEWQPESGVRSRR
jgi:hypothetical protein